MPDQMDRAAELNDAWLAERIAAVRPPAGPSRTHCLDCEAEIPALRRDRSPGVTRCVPCQHKMEIARAR